jgi:hypothetical protein
MTELLRGLWFRPVRHDDIPNYIVKPDFAPMSLRPFTREDALRPWSGHSCRVIYTIDIDHEDERPTIRLVSLVRFPFNRQAQRHAVVIGVRK